jgi:DNA replication protein DnaC
MSDSASGNPSIPKEEIFRLATSQFNRQAQDMLFLGPAGLDKTALAQTLGYQAIKSGSSVLYRALRETLAGSCGILPRFSPAPCEHV